MADDQGGFAAATGHAALYRTQRGLGPCPAYVCGLGSKGTTGWPFTNAHFLPSVDNDAEAIGNCLTGRSAWAIDASGEVPTAPMNASSSFSPAADVHASHDARETRSSQERLQQGFRSGETLNEELPELLGGTLIRQLRRRACSTRHHRLQIERVSIGLHAQHFVETVVLRVVVA